MEKLSRKINKKREKMINIAEKLGLQSPEVLVISQELDILINEYFAQKANLK
ncbi:hypothetical protein LSPCS325_52140 [Lysinibacillus sp. CTST325]